MPLPFEFTIDGPAVSQQTRRRTRYHAWIDDIRDAARARWPPDEPPVTGPVQLTITYVYEETALDVDNIPKPFADALKGLVYEDDVQVNDLICRRRDMTTELRVLDPSNVLAGALDQGVEFLHIVVSPAPDQATIP
jgi:Holliday junction resolvase RusA-like endonuclease